MFDALLKSKFYSKCKTALKLTKTRIEMIRRKRSSMEKFLKKDIVDLLKDNLDINAYGRAEGLLIELNMSVCYNFVAQFCTCLLSPGCVNLMDKQRDCPEECKEAVPSLMFAAARFADLPELRELRAIFLEKYGNTLDAYVNQEFVGRLKALPPTKEMKIQLLQNIALESGKSWDSKALEQKLYNPPPSDQAWTENTNYEKLTSPKYKSEPVKKINKKDTENNASGTSPRKIKELPSYRTRRATEDRYKLQANENNAVQEKDSENIVKSFNRNGNQYKPNPERITCEEKLDEKKHSESKFAPPPSHHRRRSSEVKYELEAEVKNTIHEGDLEDIPSMDVKATSSKQNEQMKESNSEKKGNEAKSDEMKFYLRKFGPLSYRNKKFSDDTDKVLNEENSGKTASAYIRVAKFDQDVGKSKLNSERNEEKSDEKRPFQSKFAPPPPYTFSKPEKYEIKLQAAPSIEEDTHHEDDSAAKTKPKPRSVRSVRSRRSIQPPVDDIIVNNDDILGAIRQELATKPGHRSTHDQMAEDEREMNELLTHYSRKDSPDRGKGLSFRSKDRRRRASSFGQGITSPKDKDNMIEPGRTSSYQSDSGRA